MEKFIDIIFFAILAGIILYRLRDVLGEKTGFQGRERDTEDDTVHSYDDALSQDDVVVPLPNRRTKEADTLVGSDAQKCLTQIKKVDASFNEEHFLAGATQAFKMILEAYAKGEKETIRQMASREVAKVFGASIDARRRAKQILESTFERLLSAEILEASLEKKIASIQIKFTSERTDVLYDKKGNILEGNPDTISEFIDIWTFERKITDANPNWTLTSTTNEAN